MADCSQGILRWFASYCKDSRSRCANPAATCCSGGDEASGEQALSKAQRFFRGLKIVESEEEREFIRHKAVTGKLFAKLQLEGGGSLDFSPRISGMSPAFNDPSIRSRKVGKGASEGEQTFALSASIDFNEAEKLRSEYERYGAQKPLSEPRAQRLLEDFASGYLEMYPDPVAQLPMPADGTVVVVGDTHGQLKDVLMLFRLNGPPSARTVYLFNGDIADRGSHACEIFFLLAAYFLADPRSVVINRGNHEDSAMHMFSAERGGGFYDEVMSKYSSVLYNTFVSLLSCLSLATVLGQKIFVVHGGLSVEKSLTLQRINDIDHTSCTMPAKAKKGSLERVWQDLMWSDPMERDGIEPSVRGCGLMFGGDWTQGFLDTNNLELIIRSHENPDNQLGYQWFHSERLVTIFSASNYSGFAVNKGSVVIFESSSFPSRKIQSYYSPTLDAIKSLASTVGSERWIVNGNAQRLRDARGIKDVWWRKELQKIMVTLVVMKPAIWEKFLQMTGGLPLIGYDTWRAVMSDVMGSDWQWDLAWKSWGLGSTKNRINFFDFLRRFTVVLAKNEYMSFKFKAIAAVYENILGLHTRLSETIGLFDKDGDGAVDIWEMREVLGSFELGLCPSQLDCLLHTLFKVPQLDGPSPEAEQEETPPAVSIAEFLGRFTMAYKHAEDVLTEEAQTEELRLVREALGKIGHVVASMPLEDIRGVAQATAAPGAVPPKFLLRAEAGSSSAAEALLAEKFTTLFEVIDEDHNGFIETEEFVRGIWALPGIEMVKLSNGSRLTEEKVRDLADVVGKGGSISILGFLEALELDVGGDQDLADSLAEHILSVLLRHRSSIRTAALRFHGEASGRVRRADFHAILAALNSAVVETGEAKHKPWSESQIFELCEAFAVDESGMIDYEAVLTSFEVVDSEHPAMAVRFQRRVPRAEPRPPSWWQRLLPG